MTFSRLANYLQVQVVVVPCSFLSGAITGAASVATFPRHVAAEHGAPAGEPFTAVSRSQAVRGWPRASRTGTSIGTYKRHVHGRLACRLTSFVGSTGPGPRSTSAS